MCCAQPWHVERVLGRPAWLLVFCPLLSCAFCALVLGVHVAAPSQREGGMPAV